MKWYGYVKGSEANSPSHMEEITLSARPKELRRLSEFLQRVASLIEEHGEKFGHEHFEDFAREVASNGSRFVIVASESTD